MARLKRIALYVSAAAVIVGIWTGDPRLFLFGFFAAAMIFLSFNGDQEGRL